MNSSKEADTHFPGIVKSEPVFRESFSGRSDDRTEVTSCINLETKVSGVQDETVSDFKKAGSSVDSGIKIKTEIKDESELTHKSVDFSPKSEEREDQKFPQNVKLETDSETIKKASSSVDSGIKIKTEIKDESELTHESVDFSPKSEECEDQKFPQNVKLETDSETIKEESYSDDFKPCFIVTEIKDESESTYESVGFSRKSEECEDQKSPQNVKSEPDSEIIKEESYSGDFKPCFNNDAAPSPLVNERTTIKTEEKPLVGSQSGPKIDHRSKTVKLINVSVVLEDLFPSHLRKLGQMHFNTPSCSCIYCRREFTCSSDSKLSSQNRGSKKQLPQVQSSKFKSGQKSSRRFNLKLELKEEREGTPYQCEECSLKFGSRRALNAHSKEHKIRKTYKYKCKLCAKQFRLLSSLLSHAKDHSDSKPFKCKQCPARFWFESFLQSHLRVHVKRRRFKSKKRPIKCQRCAADFRCRANLKFHMQKHWREDAKRPQKRTTSQSDFDSESDDLPFEFVDCCLNSEDGNASECSHVEQPTNCSAPNDACSCLPCFLTRKRVMLADDSNASSVSGNFVSNPP